MNYDDIINLPHFHAEGRPYMNKHDRAGQFMPFKSLKGFDEMVDEREFDINKDKAHFEYDPETSEPEWFEEEIYYS